MPPPSAPIRLPWKLAPLIVVAAAWLAFLGVARHTWVLDDVRLVRDNSEVARGPSAIAGLLAEGSPRDAEMDDYGPLTMASFALEAPLWRQADGSLRPAGFHLTNLLLHGLCVLLLLQVLLQLAPGRPVIALGGALVFAVHPLQAAAVAPLMGRAILLAAGFSLLTVLAWRAWTRGRIAGLPVALACWLLALLSHVAALGVPLVVLLLDRALPARERAGRAWSWAGLAFLLPLGAFLGLWSGLAPGPIDLPAQGLGARLAVGAEGWVRLILGLVIPVGARGDHTDEALGGVGFEVDAATLACVGFVVVVTIGILLRVRAGRAGAPALIWLAGLALAVPAAALLPAGRPLEARWGYLAALALVPAAGLLAGALLRSGRLSAGALRLRAAVVGALAIILLVGLAQREARAWRDDDAFHERLLARNPTHVRAMVRLARTQRRTATTLRIRAAGLRADDTRRITLLEERQAALARAEIWSRRATAHELGRDDARAWRELGLLHLASDRSAEALRALERARELEPLLKTAPTAASGGWSLRQAQDAGELYFAIGRAREALGSRETAADAFLMAATFDPDRPDYLFRAGMALCRVNRYAEGLGFLQGALRATSEGSRREEIAGAIDEARRSARRIARDLVQRGLTARDESKMRAAVTLFEQALEVNPSSVEARIEAGWLRGWWFGNYVLAEQRFREAEALLDESEIPADDERRRRITRLRTDLAEQKAKEDAEGK